MPRQSAAALAISLATVAKIPQRPVVPRAFRRGSAEAASWTEIVNAQPADWFQPGDMPLLEAYCRTIVHHRRLSAEMDQQHDGAGAPFIVMSTHGRPTSNPMYAIQTMLVRQMATLAVKLRLSQSTRVNAHVAGTRGRAQARLVDSQSGYGDSDKPWQRSGS